MRKYVLLKKIHSKQVRIYIKRNREIFSALDSYSLVPLG